MDLATPGESIQMNPQKHALNQEIRLTNRACYRHNETRKFWWI